MAGPGVILWLRFTVWAGVAVTDVDICNLALSYLGDSATVTSIAPPEGSAQAQHCARFYPMALALMLESHEWIFITRRVSLALLTTPYNYQWLYAYALPATANSILTIIPLDEYYGCTGWSYVWDEYLFECEREKWRDFQIELDGNGRQVILSNVEDAIARFTSSQVDMSMVSALFTDALAWKLASMLAGPLIKGETGAAESARCLKMFGILEAQAEAQDANQRHGAPKPKPVWMRDR